jgi:hypothetical protein
LATSVRVLVHDTPNSVSLLAQLGKKEGRFYSTASTWDSANPLSHMGLIGVAMVPGASTSYYAPLDDTVPTNPPRWIDF